MTKDQLIDAIHAQCYALDPTIAVTKKEIEGVLAAQAVIITCHLAAGATDADMSAEVIVPGLGKLVTDNRPARESRNPRTGEPVHVKAKRVVKFRPSKTLRDAVAGEG